MIYRNLTGYKYETLTSEVFQTPDIIAEIDTEYIKISAGMMLIKERYAWDGPSGPTFDTRTFMRGSLCHDALYQLIREGSLPKTHRKYADELLRQICIEDGMNKIRAWYVYRAVRIFGRFTSRPRKNPRGQSIEIRSKQL